MKSNPQSRKLKPSLARHASATRLRTTILSLSWYVAWIQAYLSYTSKYNKYWLFNFNFFTITALFAILLMPFGLLKLHRIITDHSWNGVILDKKLLYYDTAEIGMFLTMRFGREKIIFLSETDKGNLQQLIFFGGLVLNADYYKKGDRVRHYKGLDFYEKLDKTGDKTVICLNCGHISEIERNTCIKCGLELQK